MKRLAILLPLAIVVIISPFVRAEGEPLSDTALNSIRTTCADAQVSIQRLQQSEKPIRINRGHLYDMTLKLMVNLNSRVAVNNIDSLELLSITGDYEKKLKLFVTDYTNYDKSLSALIKLDCSEQPQKFYDDLVIARSLRSKLAQTVRDLNGLLDSYQADMNSLKELVGVNL